MKGEECMKLENRLKELRARELKNSETIGITN